MYEYISDTSAISIIKAVTIGFHCVVFRSFKILSGVTGKYLIRISKLPYFNRHGDCRKRRTNSDLRHIDIMLFNVHAFMIS